jgi:UDP-hydrolysing UDP-N-acetyl-D-glucosamine 2-epimerase
VTAVRRVCVVTGTRAEYGLLRELLALLDARPDAELQLLVTGAHLAPGHGLTINQIEEDGHVPSARVEMLLDSDSGAGAAKSLALATIGVADALERLQPDLVVVLGDRYELLAVAQVALLLRIPLVHLHGGERSEGQIDEAVRHALTKLSHLHLVAAEQYRRRILQLGEQPDRVHVVGAPGLDQLVREPLLERDELAAALGLDLSSPLLVVTYHPVTLRDAAGDAAVDAVTQALDAVSDTVVVVTGPNADPGGHDHAARLLRWARDRAPRARYATSLGSRLYLSAVKHSAAVVGNSSSGIIEAPALGIPTVNVGPRQDGRLRAASVIDCGESAAAIEAAVRQALTPGFQHAARSTESPYGGPGASARIADRIMVVPLEGLLVKRFRDLPSPAGPAL